MTHSQHHGSAQQTRQRCTICSLFQAMGRGQYRSSYDREMYLQHLQQAHGVSLAGDRGGLTDSKGEAES
jgi:hypothetical protein